MAFCVCVIVVFAAKKSFLTWESGFKRGRNRKNVKDKDQKKLRTDSPLSTTNTTSRLEFRRQRRKKRLGKSSLMETERERMAAWALDPFEKST